ncbi:glycoside hydrolase family 38 C-terminal domain-containing protein [Caldilinea sp.]|uniref:alpha-mannosidase n=1 Tax=Caldilinea sp. TaxID=2293560 RepID=UPI002BDDD889|nr:glycoside hydrolase family 38 C-terminal domain-containing protein [Caldilinea sp.]HRA64493.1 glycoside hydrolase family 38 C-terminal domain-containing protein [Caldilinea sp.]
MPDFVAYTDQHLTTALQRLGEGVYTIVAPLEIAAWRTKEPVPFAARTTGEPLQLQIGDAWGELFDAAWFRFTGVIPAQAAGQHVVLLLDVNGELCVVDERGEPVRGLTNVASEFEKSLGLPGKRVLPVSENAQAGVRVEVWADAGCNDLFGLVQENGVIKDAWIAVCRPEIKALYYDFEVLREAMTVLPAESARRAQIRYALHDAMHLIWRGLDPDAVAAARARLRGELAKHNGDASLTISAVGHAHIDLAWLWPLRETKRKGARTFATVLANMALYREYVFAASQAQLFQWMKEDYPGLFARIKARVAEGRIEPQGALWVEPDTNVTGGEALIRQILYGRRFFQEEFGVEVDYVWLPDTFGYSGALPQIMARAGIRHFSTQKLSWSLINPFPHHSFRWQGIDGSEVLVHMLPEETYNGPAAPRSLAKIEQNYRDKGVSGHALMAYGIGDGGGGPGEEHLERLARLGNFAGLPPVQQEWTAAFFEKWAQEADRFATWQGELYLERHQGTFTTNAANKWYNRRMEQALRETEWMAAIAQLVTGAGYPRAALDAIWREVLLYQFHDILPGSSIKRVYDECLPRYAALLAETADLLRAAQQALAAQIDTTVAQQPVICFNSLNWERATWQKIGQAWHNVRTPALGYTVFDAAQPADVFPEPVAATDRLENDRLVVQFDASGAVVSLFDKLNQRECVPAGALANRLALYHDPGDTWDFPMEYAESAPRYLELTAARAWVNGPHAVVEQAYHVGHSELIQTIRLTAGSPLVEFATQARWREPRTMLRVTFPVAVHADEARYEIQFGHIRRPTHRNTTWDLARAETPAHKWVDLSQRDYGVALLNDSKYGHQIKGNTIDLNLLRSVPYPGPRLVTDDAVAPGDPHPAYTDQGDHTFRYALYPHGGDGLCAGVVQAAYDFNIPVQVVEATPHPGALPVAASWIEIDSPDVVMETVKLAEDGDGLIVRAYEATGATVQTHLLPGFLLSSVEEADLLERPERALDVAGDAIDLMFRPFEIKTLRLRPVRESSQSESVHHAVS